jgi:formylmethanofuran dehydrogenase subunit E
MTNTSAKILNLPAENRRANFSAVIATIEPSNLLQFPSLFEPKDVAEVGTVADEFLGLCGSCGETVYSLDAHEVSPVLSCSQCLAERAQWFVPAVAIRTAA